MFWSGKMKMVDHKVSFYSCLFQSLVLIGICEIVHTLSFPRKRESGTESYGIPAFEGMTKRGTGMSKRGTGMTL